MDDDRRKEVRRLWGEKRAVMVWKREGCILMVVGMRLDWVCWLIDVEEVWWDEIELDVLVVKMEVLVDCIIVANSKEAQPGGYIMSSRPRVAEAKAKKRREKVI